MNFILNLSLLPFYDLWPWLTLLWNLLKDTFFPHFLPPSMLKLWSFGLWFVLSRSFKIWVFYFYLSLKPSLPPSFFFFIFVLASLSFLLFLFPLFALLYFPALYTIGKCSNLDLDRAIPVTSLSKTPCKRKGREREREREWAEWEAQGKRHSKLASLLKLLSKLIFQFSLSHCLNAQTRQVFWINFILSYAFSLSLSLSLSLHAICYCWACLARKRHLSNKFVQTLIHFQPRILHQNNQTNINNFKFLCFLSCKQTSNLIFLNLFYQF